MRIPQPTPVQGALTSTPAPRRVWGRAPHYASAARTAGDALERDLVDAMQRCLTGRKLPEPRMVFSNVRRGQKHLAPGLGEIVALMLGAGVPAAEVETQMGGALRAFIMRSEAAPALTEAVTRETMAQGAADVAVRAAELAPASLPAVEAAIATAEAHRTGLGRLVHALRTQGARLRRP